eukprot:g1588.t1
MMAIIGMFFQDGLTGSAWEYCKFCIPLCQVAGKFPGYLSTSQKLLFSDIPNGLAAISKVPLAGWIQIFGYCAYCEISAGYDADITKRTPGDMGWNPPLFSGNDPETKTRRLNAELANGRLAMMATMGMFFQEQ